MHLSRIHHFFLAINKEVPRVSNLRAQLSSEEGRLKEERKSFDVFFHLYGCISSHYELI